MTMEPSKLLQLPNSGLCDNKQQSLDKAAIVIFHVESTSFYSSAEICEISAQCLRNDNSFKQSIIPNVGFDKQATAKNGYEIRWISWTNKKLYHNRIEVTNALSPSEGLESFLEFLKNKAGEAGGQVLLAGHNCSSFSARMFIREMKKYDLLDSFQSIVLGFIDTIPIFKSHLKERFREKKSFDLETLAKDYDLQNLDKVEIIAKLITKIGCDESNMKESAKNVDKFIASMPENVARIKIGLRPIASVVSKTMLTNIGKAGISMDLLENEYRRNGNDGVATLLKEIIKSKKKIQPITEILHARTSMDTDNTPATDSG